MLLIAHMTLLILMLQMYLARNICLLLARSVGPLRKNCDWTHGSNISPIFLLSFYLDMPCSSCSGFLSPSSPHEVACCAGRTSAPLTTSKRPDKGMVSI